MENKMITSRKSNAIFVIVILFSSLIGVLFYNYSNIAETSYIKITDLALGQKVVCITFDDGWASTLASIPILENLDFKATYFIITEYTNNQFPAYLSWNEIEYMNQQGFDIESHTYNHVNMSNLSPQTLAMEVRESKMDLQGHGIKSEILAYPGGDGCYNTTVQQAVSQYYSFGRSITNNVLNLNKYGVYCMPSYGIFNSTTTEQFKSIVNKAQGDNVVILVYHKLSIFGDDRLTVSYFNFEQQMNYLKHNGFNVISLKQLLLEGKQ
jgi:hypothetical protein